MRRAAKTLFALGLAISTVCPVLAADALIVAPVAGYDAGPLPPVRRQLTTYMAKYPFGVLREDYTPLGAPGVSKRAYYGVPRHYATLHASPKRWARRVHRRTIVTARY